MKAVCTFTVEMMFEDHRDISPYDMREELEKIIQQRFSPDLINVNLDDEHTEGPDDIEETDEEPSKSLMGFVGAAPDLQLEKEPEWVIARRKDNEDKLEFYYLAIPADFSNSYPGFLTTGEAAWTEDKSMAMYFRVFQAAHDIQKMLVTKQSDFPFVLSTNSGMFTRGIAAYLGNEKTATDY